MRARINGALDAAASSGDIDRAAVELNGLAEQIALYAEQRDVELFVEASLNRRLLNQLSAANLDGAAAAETLRYLRENPALAAALTFAVNDEEDDLEAVCATLNLLRRGFGQQLNEYANLAAAMCVVHDGPVEKRVNENLVRADDPLSLFKYYVDNEKRMSFGVRDVPVELLVYVVDNTAGASERQWALREYAGARDVGSLFFKIKYDELHLRTGAPKKCTQVGYSLMSVAQYGGVCADQTYFATAVGKSIGIPAAYIAGRDADVSHAFVGFLQSKGRAAQWNFDSGRYETYQGVRGETRDPQTGEMIPDSYVGLTAELIGVEPESRRAAIAFLDAAQILGKVAEQGRPAAPMFDAATMKSARNTPRGGDAESRLELIEAGLRLNPGLRDAWLEIATMAERGELSYDQKERWAGILTRMCGRDYPDFSLDILRPMIATVAEVERQNELWNSAFASFKSRADLAAEIRVAQGEMWEKEGNRKTASKCYEDVVERYVNAGPFVMIALHRLELLYREANRPDTAAAIYGAAWKQARRPAGMAPIYAMQSNWYQIGDRYGRILAEIGKSGEAASVRAALMRF